jgi:hypothetical protein
MKQEHLSAGRSWFVAREVLSTKTRDFDRHQKSQLALGSYARYFHGIGKQQDSQEQELHDQQSTSINFTLLLHFGTLNDDVALLLLAMPCFGSS